MKSFSFGFVLHWTFIMCKGIVSISKALEENFYLTQQYLDCKTCSFFSFLKISEVIFEAVNKKIVDVLI